MLKRLFTLLFAMYMFVTPSFAAIASNETEIMPRWQSVSSIDSSLIIEDTGMAYVLIRYIGSNTLQKITFETKLQKKFLFFFWGDVANGETDHTWVRSFTAQTGSFSHTLQLEETGTYRAVIDITAVSTDGSSETIQRVHEYVYE